MLTAQCHMALRKVLYYTAQQLKGCSRARGARLLAPRCPRGSEGQQRAGHWGRLCISVLRIGAAARQKAPKCEVGCFPYGDGRKATSRCKGRSSASTGNMAFRTYRGAALFCALLRTSAHNSAGCALIVRKCDCAEMHIIPIADQFTESGPIADQWLGCDNITRSARLSRDAAPVSAARGSDAQSAPGSDAQSAPGSDAAPVSAAPGSDAQSATRRSQHAAPVSDAQSAPVSASQR
jgi:hypothetical protein